MKPLGIYDGSNTVFTVTCEPILGLFVNGIFQHPDIDYTINGSVITFAVAPKPSDWVHVV